MKTTLDWLGTSTFRLAIGETVIFLDAYMDRVPAAPPVGLSAKDVRQADWVLVGHSHFDHIAGTEVIANNTSAQVIGSYESMRVLKAAGVPEPQLKTASGGERFRLTDGVTVRVFPSLHACTWILTDVAPDVEQFGHTGLTQDERATCPGLVQHIMGIISEGGETAETIRNHVLGSVGSMDDGGPLVYLIETPDLTIFWQDTSGAWKGTIEPLSADVAILAASTRANVNGEPIQGSMAQFVAMEASILGAKRVFLGHHDNWMPPVTSDTFDMAPVHAELKLQAPDAALIEVTYLANTVLCD
ncbi:MAG TPA: MBL fold metallo-hydrolase [Dehalococcoidia bacterium]|nr:MBL fold metallo-hydrolase [Dehalococcoidia bacterium]